MIKIPRGGLDRWGRKKKEVYFSIIFPRVSPRKWIRDGRRRTDKRRNSCAKTTGCFVSRHFVGGAGKGPQRKPKKGEGKGEGAKGSPHLLFKIVTSRRRRGGRMSKTVNRPCRANENRLRRPGRGEKTHLDEKPLWGKPTSTTHPRGKIATGPGLRKEGRKRLDLHKGRQKKKKFARRDDAKRTQRKTGKRVTDTQKDRGGKGEPYPHQKKCLLTRKRSPGKGNPRGWLEVIQASTEELFQFPHKPTEDQPDNHNATRKRASYYYETGEKLHKNISGERPTSVGVKENLPSSSRQAQSRKKEGENEKVKNRGRISGRGSLTLKWESIRNTSGVLYSGERKHILRPSSNESERPLWPKRGAAGND